MQKDCAEVRVYHGLKGPVSASPFFSLAWLLPTRSYLSEVLAMRSELPTDTQLLWGHAMWGS